jgi:hypothetical protein
MHARRARDCEDLVANSDTPSSDGLPWENADAASEDPDSPAVRFARTLGTYFEAASEGQRARLLAELGRQLAVEVKHAPPEILAEEVNRAWPRLPVPAVLLALIEGRDTLREAARDEAEAHDAGIDDYSSDLDAGGAIADLLRQALESAAPASHAQSQRAATSPTPASGPAANAPVPTKRTLADVAARMAPGKPRDFVERFIGKPFGVLVSDLDDVGDANELAKIVQNVNRALAPDFRAIGLKTAREFVRRGALKLSVPTKASSGYMIVRSEDLTTS